MRKNWRYYTAIAVVMLFGLALLFVQTDGFRAFTEESARMLALSEDNPELPEVHLEDSKEREYSLSDYQGNYVLITFIYTNCTDVCPVLETNFAELYEMLPQDYIGSYLDFLTISFDPENDDPETLENYRKYFDSDGETWRMARVNDDEELDGLLDSLGATVIQDDDGDFTHNAAFYLINPAGHLEEIYEFDEIEETASDVERILQKETDSSL